LQRGREARERASGGLQAAMIVYCQDDEPRAS
jgi:hypothetical protein